jgi:Methyltransferase domain
MARIAQSMTHGSTSQRSEQRSGERSGPHFGFDRIARLYRWMEYLSFGPALQRCRTRFLPQLRHSRNALVFGDGDGRFLKALFTDNPKIHADAIDSSGSMLDLLHERISHIGAANRLRTHHTDALHFIPQPSLGTASEPYDLVATHFFLDCLSTQQVQKLVTNLQPHLAPEALWVISEFRIPNTRMRLPAHLVVGSLYLAFRIMTGLRTTQLPLYSEVLLNAGFRRLEERSSLAGLLTSQLWQYTPVDTITTPSFRPI